MHCSYEVLGGLHRITARQQLAKEETMGKMEYVEAKIFIGLTDGEALRLGSRYNANGHLTHEMTHQEYVSTILLQLMRKYICTYVYQQACQLCNDIIYMSIRVGRSMQGQTTSNDWRKSYV